MKRIRNDILPLLLIAAITIGCFIVFWKLLDVVVLSLSLAVVLYPLYLSCCRVINRYLSAALVTTLIFTILLAAIIISVTVFSENSTTIQGIITTIQSWIQNPATDPRIFGLPFERTQVDSWINQAESLFVRYWYTLSSDITLIAIKTIVFFVSLYLFLLHGMHIHDRILARVPEDLKEHVTTLSSASVDTLYAIYIVHIGIAALTFIIAIPFFLFLGYGNVLFFSYLTALCELIPVLGSSVVFIFLGTYALALGDLNSVLILFFFGYIGVSALPEIFVRPVLMGRRVKLHPFLMLVGFFGGIITMGMVGFVLGPVLIVLLVTGYKIVTGDARGSGQPDTEENS